MVAQGLLRSGGDWHAPPAGLMAAIVSTIQALTNALCPARALTIVPATMTGFPGDGSSAYMLPLLQLHLAYMTQVTAPFSRDLPNAHTGHKGHHPHYNLITFDKYDSRDCNDPSKVCIFEGVQVSSNIPKNENTNATTLLFRLLVRF